MSETDIMLNDTSFTAATLCVITNMANKIRDTRYQTSPELIASLQEADRTQIDQTMADDRNQFYLKYTKMVRSFAVAMSHIATPCARLVASAGITKVIYGDTYRSEQGLAELKFLGIQIAYLPKEHQLPS